MPEYPDIVLYLHALEPRVQNRTLERIRITSPFLLRSVDVPLVEAHGKRVVELLRLGKRIVLGLETELFLVLHLMIAGRLQWKERGAHVPRRIGLAAFDFEGGSLLVTEASTHKRASLHLVRGRKALAALDPGGIDLFEADFTAFREALTRENHTLKRALTDPRLFSGIGNAYSDEILHRARLSPVKLTRRTSEDEILRLWTAAREVLSEWAERLQAETADAWPGKVTAFRPQMAVHGRHGQPCPECGSPVQRIVYKNNETNYCARCQTGGRLLADRSLSRLLKRDWPKSLDDLDQTRRRG